MMLPVLRAERSATRLPLILLLLAFLLLPFSAGADEPDTLGISQAAIGGFITDLELESVRRGRFRLSELNDRPLGISLIYTACAHSCSITTRHIDKVVKKARRVLGEDSFMLLSIGFDLPQDTAELMAEYATRHGVTDPNWEFAVPTHPEDLERLMEELGFIYRPGPHGYDHTVQVSLINRDGSVYRQVYGEVFDSPLLIEPLKELVLRRPAPDDSLMSYVNKRIRMWCTIYDARGDRYYFNYGIFIGLIMGGALLLGVITLVLTEIIRRRRVKA